MINYDEILDNIPAQLELPVEKDNLITEGGPLLDNPRTLVVKHDVFDITAVEVAFNSSEVKTLVKEFEAIPVVETDTQATQGLNVAMKARRLASDISKMRKELTAPYIVFQKKAISIEKEYTSQLEEIENALLERIDDYQEARKKRLADHNLIDLSFDNLTVEEGSTQVKSYHEITVDDITKVPAKYLKVDQKAVQEDIKKGILNISGLTIHKVNKRKYRLKPGKK